MTKIFTKMTTLQKIKELNKACKNSLGIQCYSDGWEVTSFRKGSPLEPQRYVLGIVTYETFEKAIDEAYKFVFKK